ncbi:uncharacterized protein LOC122930636 isoform X2 [Bufo gargarizans]|uniref:uncharacterized protein LOC122930636 isoform X2 n=1 Tax=Bufo gargarizans TaxID=30331 RepID=UPI001CF1B3ED|nr:uncharacterized protein LOC122930636 isoform X2 [Bufo gargarizans]
MMPAAAALRTSVLLCVLLVSASSSSSRVQSSSQVVSVSAGDTVTFSCSDESNRTRTLSDVTLVIWRREDGAHSLHYVSDGNKNTSNFTDPRISFRSAQMPPALQIRDARPGDAGNYTCTISMVGSGNIYKFWTLQISDSSHFASIYISSSVIGALVMLILIAGIIYCKFCSKRNTIPSQIHQTSPEDNEKEEPVYHNAQEDYFLRFNALYDRTPASSLAQRPHNL